MAVLIVCLDLHFFSRVGGPAHIFLAPRVPLLDWCMAVQPTGAGSWVMVSLFRPGYLYRHSLPTLASGVLSFFSMCRTSFRERLTKERKGALMGVELGEASPPEQDALDNLISEYRYGIVHDNSG